MIVVLLWIAFLVIFGLSRLRLYQTEGTRDKIVLTMYGLGAVVALAVGFVGDWIHAGVMLGGWLLLPFVADPLVNHLAGDQSGANKPSVAAVAHGQRMGRLNRGEMSLGDYFKEGHENDDAARERLESLASRRDIGGVLAKYKISSARFFDLREKLIKVRDIEWDVLGNAADLERLIVLVAKQKSETDIGNAFRGRKRG